MHELTEDLREAFVALLTTPPTTFAGAVAVLRYLNTKPSAFASNDSGGSIMGEALESNDYYDGAGETFLPMLADTLERLSVGA